MMSKIREPGDQIIEAMHHALPGERDQFHLAFIARLEAHGIAQQGYSSRKPRAAARSKRRAVFVSKKW